MPEIEKVITYEPISLDEAKKAVRIALDVRGQIRKLLPKPALCPAGGNQSSFVFFCTSVKLLLSPFATVSTIS
jgi:hypothetical protein